MQELNTYWVPEGASDDPEGVLANDQAHQAGKSVYTSLRTYDHKPFHMEKHLQRLVFSSKKMGFELLVPGHSIQKAVIDLIQRHPTQEQFLRVTATPKHVVIISRPLEIDDSIYQGVSVGLAQLQRDADTIQAKTFPTEAIAEAYLAAAQQGQHDVLLVDEEGCITEGSRSNVLWKKGDILYWCSHALAGITQAEVLEVAQDLFPKGLIASVEETSEGLAVDELDEVDELFITQTSRGIIPVTHVERQVIGDGNPGPVTLALSALFHSRTHPSR